MQVRSERAQTHVLTI